MFDKMETKDASFLHAFNYIYILIDFYILLCSEKKRQTIGALINNIYYVCDNNVGFMFNFQTTTIVVTHAPVQYKTPSHRICS